MRRLPLPEKVVNIALHSSKANGPHGMHFVPAPRTAQNWHIDKPAATRTQHGGRHSRAVWRWALPVLNAAISTGRDWHSPSRADLGSMAEGRRRPRVMPAAADAYSSSRPTAAPIAMGCAAPITWVGCQPRNPRRAPRTNLGLDPALVRLRLVSHLRARTKRCKRPDRHDARCRVCRRLARDGHEERSPTLEGMRRAGRDGLLRQSHPTLPGPGR